MKKIPLLFKSARFASGAFGMSIILYPAISMAFSDATWQGGTAGGEWTNTTNWLGGAAPGNNTTSTTTDIATFAGGSPIISIKSTDTIGVGELVFSAGAPVYTLNVYGTLTLFGGVDGYAILNNSANQQTLIVNSPGTGSRLSTTGTISGVKIILANNAVFASPLISNSAIQLNSGYGLQWSGGDGSSSQFVNNGNFTVNNNVQLGSLAGTDTNAILSLAGNITIGELGLNTTYAGDITEQLTNRSLTMVGGSLILDGTNSYSGDTLVQSGTLQIGEASVTTASINGGVTIDSGATLQVYGTVSNSGGGVDVSGTLDVGDSSHALGTIQGLVSVENGGLLTNYGTLSGGLSNSGTANYYNAIGNSAAITNSGILNFHSGSSTAAATITNNGGTTRFIGTVDASDAQINMVAGIFDIAQATSTVTLASLVGAGTINLGNNELVLNGGGILTSTINDTGNGKLTQNGSDTLVLAGVNNYMGITTVNNGILQLGTSTDSSVSLAGSALVNGGVFQVYGAVEGGVTVSGGALQVGSGTSSQGAVAGISSITSGTAAFYGDLAGTMTNLGGTLNFYDGSDTHLASIINYHQMNVTNTALTLANYSSSNEAALNLTGTEVTITGSALIYNANDSGSNAAVIFNSSSASNILDFEGSNSVGGGATVNQGILQIGNAIGSSASLSGPVTLNDGELNLYGSIDGIVTITEPSSANIYTTNSNPLTLVNSGTTTFVGAVNTADISFILNARGILDISAVTNPRFTLANLTDNGGGTIYLGANEFFLDSNIVTLSSVIKDGNLGHNTPTGGSVRLSGAVDHTLYGANTYTGMTTLDNTTLYLGDNSGLHNDAAIQGGATLNSSHLVVYGSLAGTTTIDEYSNLTVSDNLHPLAGVINGIINNSGSLSFYNNAGSAAAAINNVTASSALYFYNASSSGSSAITNAGLVAYTGNNTADNTTILNNLGGVVDISAITNPSITIGAISGLGTIVLGSNELITGTFDQNAIIDGLIQETSAGGALTKIGSGKLTLNNQNTYTGDTTVNQGILVIGDSQHVNASIAGDAVVNSAGKLTGYGTIGGDLTNYGSVMPGGDNLVPGGLTVLGNYSQDANATYYVTFDSSSSVNLLTVGGAAQLAGTLDISLPSNGLIVDYPYPLLIANTTTDSFSTIKVHPFFNAWLQNNLIESETSFGPNTNTLVNVLISYNEASMRAASETPNQRAVIENLIGTRGNMAINNAITQTASENDLSELLDQLSGATYANQQLAIAGSGQIFENEIAGRLEKDTWCWVSEYRRGAQKIHCNDEKYWLKVYVGRNELLDTHHVSGLTTDNYGAALGAEIAVKNSTILGAALAFTHINDETTGIEDATANNELYQAAIYGRYDFNQWRIGLGVDYGVTDSSNSNRYIENTSVGTVQTHASYTSALLGLQFYSSYGVTLAQGYDIRPTIGVIYQRVPGRDFSEDSKTGFELEINADSFQSTRSQLGVALEGALIFDIQPHLYLAWEHEFGDNSAGFEANFVGLEPSFSILGTEIGRNAVYINGSLTVLAYRQFDFSLAYQGRFASELNENRVVFAVGFM